jgi:hypothetical protein
MQKSVGYFSYRRSMRTRQGAWRCKDLFFSSLSNILLSPTARPKDTWGLYGSGSDFPMLGRRTSCLPVRRMLLQIAQAPQMASAEIIFEGLRNTGN